MSSYPHLPYYSINETVGLRGTGGLFIVKTISGKFEGNRRYLIQNVRTDEKLYIPEHKLCKVYEVADLCPSFAVLMTRLKHKIKPFDGSDPDE